MLNITPPLARYYLAAMKKISHPVAALSPWHFFIKEGRKAQLGDQAGPALVKSSTEVEDFYRAYTLPKFEPINLRSHIANNTQALIEGYIGLDGGSTSSKCVLVNDDGEILQKSISSPRATLWKI